MVDTLITFLKQILSVKVGERICLHRDLDSLHDVLDKDILPADYGGTLKPLKEINGNLLYKHFLRIQSCEHVKLLL